MATNKQDKILNVPNKRAQCQACLNTAERAALRPKGNVPELRFPGFEGEWEKTNLGVICSSFDYGMNVPAKEFDGMNKYIRITDIDDTSHTYSHESIVSPDGDLLDKYLVESGDILFARTGASVGKTYHYDDKDGKLFFAGFLIRAKVKTQFDSRFVFLQTLTREYQKWVGIMSARSGQPGINSQEYATYSFSVPPLSEQKKIADFLTLLDARIATQRKIIEKIESLMMGIYDNVFSKSKPNISLGEVCRIKKGQQVNGSELHSKGLYYVMNGGIEPSGYLDDFNTPGNTISISEGGNSCGYIQYNEAPFWSGGHCYTLETTKRIDTKYLFHTLKAQQSNIMKLRIGSGLPNIQKKDLERFEIFLPAWHEQQTAAKGLDAVLHKIDLEKSFLYDLLKQKQYLLSKMFI